MNTGGITGFLSGYLGNSAVWNVEMASRSNSTGSGAIAGSASESCMYCCCAFDMAFDFPPENINFHGGLAGGARDSSLTKSYFCGSKDDPSIGGHLIGAAARITGDDNFIVSGAKALGNYSESDLTHSTIHEAAFTNGYLTERLGVSDWYEGPAGFPLPFEYSGTVEVTGVSLDLHSAALEKGAEIRLAAKVAPYNATDMEVVWQSYDKTVATVDSGGLVRAVGPGSATIRVKTKDGGFTDKCKIKVTSPVSEVTLDKSSVTVEKGRSVTLTARVEPSDATNPAVTWQSYDKTIATVDSAGKVTGVSSGSTTIRVKTKDGGYIAKCKVKVTEPVIPVTGVSLNKTSVSVAKGKSYTLKATVAPSGAANPAVTWQSYDKTIATVDSAGKVKGIAPGTTTIRVKTKDGGFTAKCKVTVTVPVTGVALDVTGVTLKVGKTRTLTATVMPADATDQKVSWSSDKPEVARVNSSGKITALKKGTAAITATTKDGGFTASCKVTVKD